MVELRLICTETQVDALSDVLEALDALSVSVEDADADTVAENGLFAEPGMPPPKSGWARSRVTAMFSGEAQASEALTALQSKDFFEHSRFLSINPVKDQDWVRLTQSQFAPVQIKEDFWIVPSWHEPPAQARWVIRLDPGLAFGTGTHPTTRMCLRWIADSPQCRLYATRVLDYGCGSGILAIAAAKFGVGNVKAVDIDPEAVKASLLNASANGVTFNAGLPERMNERYDVVLANILATPLKVLAPMLCSYVSLGGSLVLSGILERQAPELQEVYAPYCQLRIADQEDGWILMTSGA